MFEFLADHFYRLSWKNRWHTDTVMRETPLSNCEREFILNNIAQQRVQILLLWYLSTLFLKDISIIWFCSIKCDKGVQMKRDPWIWEVLRSEKLHSSDELVHLIVERWNRLFHITFCEVLTLFFFPQIWKHWRISYNHSIISFQTRLLGSVYFVLSSVSVWITKYQLIDLQMFI